MKKYPYINWNVFLKDVHQTRYEKCISCNESCHWGVKFNYTPIDFDYLKLCKKCQEGKTIKDSIFIDQNLKFWLRKL